MLLPVFEAFDHISLLPPGMATVAQLSAATRVKLSGSCDVFKRLEENKTVLHLLCSLNRAEELAALLQGMSEEDAAKALAQVCPCCMNERCCRLLLTR